MLPRTLRIHTALEIREIISKTRPRHTNLMTAWTRKRASGPLRATVLCSKKVDPRATARNAVKRKIRSALAKLAKENTVHADVVISAKAAIKAVPYSEIEQSLIHVISLP